MAARSVVRLLMAAFFAYGGIILLRHDVWSYTRWGYPRWSHDVAGALFLCAAMLLAFRRTLRLGALSSCCVLVPAAASCAWHGDFAHAIQGVALIAVIAWLVRSTGDVKLR